MKFRGDDVLFKYTLRSALPFILSMVTSQPIINELKYDVKS